MKTVFFFTALISVGGCVGIHTDIQQSKTSKAASIYYANGAKHFWSKSEHPENGSVTLKSERKWCGATLWAIVPIPLKLPVCKSYIKVSFENNEPATRHEGWVSLGSFYGCGPGVWLGSLISNGKEASFCIAE
ncbi:hypothetical protein [Pseudomonas sp. SST3]|uniref:hypothetical protein n=1 Tax=Pseudomonas sp. SST3 TaxID=2267882 RepID=UPI00144496FF|nr:hypothetical protein [Pseudomonas sp. SST3]NKQ13632.1 hypothetical protein [Pseudomonas sp. SST3]